MAEKQFKNCLVEFDKAKKNVEKEKRTFEFEVKEFMLGKGIPIKLEFFGNTFGLDIDLTVKNWENLPRKIPLDVLTDFCKEFGCEFEYTNCDGERYIFSFDGMSMGFNL